MLKKEFSLRERVLLIILAVLLLAALYIFLVHQPVVNGIENAEAQITETEMNNQILQGKVMKYNQMKDELEQIKSGSNVQELPDYDNLPAVISFLNSVLGNATDYQMTLGTSFPKEGETGIVRRTAQVSFKCDNYDAAKRSVQKLEECSFIDRVSNLVVSPSDKKQTDVMTYPVDVALTITFFERIN